MKNIMEDSCSQEKLRRMEEKKQLKCYGFSDTIMKQMIAFCGYFGPRKLSKRIIDHFDRNFKTMFSGSYKLRKSKPKWT